MPAFVYSRGDTSYIEHGGSNAKTHRVLLGFPAPSNWQGEMFPGYPGTALWRTYANPDQLQIRYPVRAQTIQAVGGVFIDSYGGGLPTGTLSGTFGFGRDSNGKTGIDRLGDLRALYNNWLETIVRTPSRSYLVSYSQRIHLWVFWGDLEITASKNSPFLVNYTLSFTATFDAGNLASTREYSPPIGPSPVDGGTPV